MNAEAAMKTELIFFGRGKYTSTVGLEWGRSLPVPSAELKDHAFHCPSHLLLIRLCWSSFQRVTPINIDPRFAQRANEAAYVDRKLLMLWVCHDYMDAVIQSLMYLNHCIIFANEDTTTITTHMQVVLMS